ncbi:MAG: hypothetical protein JWN04_3900 [Myxococcaceae bacterium]|nr:hypothetical protein [Myxococcaceae bacterium]
MTDMHALGAKIRAAQDDEASAQHDLAHARRRFLDTQRAPRPRAGVWWWSGSAALLACAAGLLLWWTPTRSTLTFRVADRPAQVLSWIESEPMADLPVRFSDGSSLLLRKHARARVEHLSARGATVRLQTGELAVSVVHRTATRWLIEAGPYRVHVIGTRFDVSFRPEDQAFALELHDGSVRLEGPGLAGGRAVVAGQRIELRHGAVEQGGSHPAHTAPSPASVKGPTASALSQDVEQAVTSAHGKRAVSVNGLDNGWLSSAQRGDYLAALAAAERVGFSTLLADARVLDLLLLGDCAFYAQRDALARQIYGAVRARAPRTEAAGAAAFNLGRLAFRSAATEADSARWFRSYLAEQPRGSLRREALGRLLEAEHASGQYEAARATASAYLLRYPNGPHAHIAKQAVLGPPP